MRILITGGTGFIGRNIIEYFATYCSFYSILTPSHRELDLTNKPAVDKFFKENDIDIVIHTAAVGVKKNQDKTGTLKTNLKMFYNLASNSGRFKQMIFLGSGAEYGMTELVKENQFKDNIPYDEYGLYKYSCSKYIEKSNKIINLRLFGVFGMYEDDSRFLSSIIKDVLNSKSIVINQNRLMDYIYVKDLCKVIDYFIVRIHSRYKPQDKFYNVTAGHYELLELAKIVRDIHGKYVEIKIKKEGMDKEYTADNSRLIKFIMPPYNTLDFKFTPIHTAIKEYYKWLEGTQCEKN